MVGILGWRLTGCRLLPALALALGTAAPAVAQDVERGAELSAEWCARCHNIEPGGAMKEEPPSFAAIAVYRNEGQIRAAMLDPHLGMPPLVQVLALDTDDLVAYITSLEETAAWQPAGE